MGAISTIGVNDATTPTPVLRNFIPAKIDGDVARFLEKSSSVASGYWPLSISLRAPQAASAAKVYRSEIALAIPVTVTEVVNGVSREKVERTLRAKVEFILPEGATEQERKDLRTVLVAILGHGHVTNAVEKLENVY